MFKEEDSLFGSSLSQYYMKLSIGDYKRPTPFKPTQWTKSKVIILPLPSELRDDTAVNYETESLKTVGDVINGAYSGGAAAAGLRMSGNVISGGMSSLIGAGAGALGQGGSSSDSRAALGDAFASAAKGTTADMFPPDQVSSAIQQGMGMAPNPNQAVMFTGPQLRDFSYSWTLFPKSKRESDKLSYVIKLLKQCALPQNEVKGQASVLKYPKMCQINFYPWDAPYGSNEWGWGPGSIIRYKKCFMAAVNANYSPSNVPAFFYENKNPVAVQLTISFKEIEYMMSHDWDDAGGGSYNGGEASGQGNFGTVAGAFGGFAAEQTSQAVNAGLDTIDKAFSFLTGGSPEAPPDNPTQAQP